MNSTDGKGVKILVVQTSYLGDVILTTPLISEIRRRFPEAELAVLCRPQAGDLLAANPDIDEVIADDKNGSGRGLGGMWRKAKDLRGRSFTMAFCPHRSFRSAFLLFLAGIPFRIGFRQSAGWFFFHCRADRDSSLHDVERNLSILGPIGFDPEKCGKELRIEVDSGRRAAVERLLTSLGVEKKAGRLTFGVNPGSVWPTKRWSGEGYAELMVRLKQRYDCDILLFGGPEDDAIVSDIQERSGHLGVTLAGRIGLADLPCVVERCDVFITNDSGPMHVAVARGIPVVAVFCATTPSLGFFPYSSRAVVVEKELPCRPCSSHGGRRCPLGTEDCIRWIKTADVLRGVDRLLNGRDGPAGPSHRPEFITL